MPVRTTSRSRRGAARQVRGAHAALSRRGVRQDLSRALGGTRWPLGEVLNLEHQLFTLRAHKPHQED